MEERWAENPEVVGSNPILDKMWLGFPFLVFVLWYFLETVVNNFIIFFIIFILVQIKLISAWLLNLLEISDISNQAWIFSYFQNLIKNSVLIFNEDDFFFSITNDLTTFTILYKMFLHQQWFLYGLILIFITQKNYNSSFINNTNFYLYIYVYSKYILFNVVNWLKYLSLISVLFIQILITKIIFISRLYFTFNKSFLLWKPLFKRWSYIGFYFKAKMFWLNKNRQKK